jgi:hypothetical protein
MTGALSQRRWIVAELALIALAVALVALFTVISPGTAPTIARFVPATLGDQPAGAVVLAREDGGLAVGLAAAPRNGHLLLVATVFGTSGAGLAHLRTSFAISTADGRRLTVGGTPCTPGCYEAVLPASGLPASASVTLNRGNRITFVLPHHGPTASALTLVHEAEAEYGAIHTLVTHERLASDPTHVVYTTYYAVAPDRLRFQIRDGIESIIIGDERWDREPGGPWQRSPQAPIQPIAPYWTPLVQDATILGTAAIHGRPCWVIAFADPQTPGFFTIWVDTKDHRTLQLEMTAAAHFMHHAYGPFNAPLTVQPPGGDRSGG